MVAEANIAELMPQEGELDVKGRIDSLVGRIATEVARDITDGRLPPGADLNTVELAARFGTSRTPVREALMLLEKEGLVEIPPRRRPRVSRISLDEIEDLYQIRSVLNSLMIQLFVRNASEALTTEMVRLQQEVKRSASQSAEEFQLARGQLHKLWLDHCGNESLRSLLGMWKMRMSVARLVHFREEDIDRSLQDHARLVQAVLERDELLATALMHSMTLSGLAAIKREHGGS